VLRRLAAAEAEAAVLRRQKELLARLLAEAEAEARGLEDKARPLAGVIPAPTAVPPPPPASSAVSARLVEVSPLLW
jgi:hypothetical protein